MPALLEYSLPFIALANLVWLFHLPINQKYASVHYYTAIVSLYFNCLHTSMLSSWISQGRLGLAYQWDTFHGPAISQISITATRQNRRDTETVENIQRVCDEKRVQRCQYKKSDV